MTDYSIAQKIVVFIFMLPIILIHALPAILVAALLSRFLNGRLSDKARIAITSAVAASGFAPAYDVYGGPMPIWVQVLHDEPINAPSALISFLVTWAIFALLQATFSSLRRRPRLAAA